MATVTGSKRTLDASYDTLTANTSVTVNGQTITSTKVSNWDTAYGWGNHASAGYAAGNHNHSGVYEPAFTKNNAFNKNFGTAAGTVAQGNDSRINNGNTAHGWGNHANAGYLTSYTETDPTVPSHVKSITTGQLGQWNTAYGDKVNSASFNTSTGVLTLTRQDSGTVTVDLDGRYLTSQAAESDTLDSVTDRGATTTNSISTGAISTSGVLSGTNDAANFYSATTQANMNTGRSGSQRFNFYVTDSVGYIRYYQDETDGTDHSVRFEIQSSSSGTNQFHFNKQVNVAGSVVTGTNGNFTTGTGGSVYAYGNVRATYGYVQGNSFRVGSTTIVTSARALQNVTANASIITSGTLSNDRLNTDVTRKQYISGSTTWASIANNSVTNGKWLDVVNTTASDRPKNDQNSNAYGYGTGLSFNTAGRGALQVYAPEQDGSQNGGMFYRSGWNGNLRSWQRLFDDEYHPNADKADKWTTPRSHTVTLTGEVTGSATQSVDGTGNKTWSIATTINNDSLNDQYVQQLSDGSSPNYQTPSSRRVNPTTSNPTNEHYAITTYGNGGNVTGQLATHFQTGATYNRAYNSSWSAWSRMFDDDYHPNADKWTTARTITLSGDLSGSVSFDGSANVTLSAQVANNSHTHAAADITSGTFTTARIPNLPASRITSGTFDSARIPSPQSGDWHNNGYVKVGTDGVMEAGRYMDWHYGDTQTSDYSARLEVMSNNGLSLSSANGYLQYGPLNTSHCHFQTDRGSFYFNKSIRVDTGIVSSYNEDLYLRRNAASDDQIQISDGYTTSSNPMRFPDGTGAAPAITFANDTDLGFYKYGTNTMAVTAGGTRRARFGSSIFLESNDVRINAYLYHNGDTDTHLRYENDRIIMKAGGVEMLDMREGATDYVDIIDRVRVTGGGNLECEGNIVAFSNASISDINQKENIEVIENPIDKIKQISGYTFDWKKSGEASGGVIAQEVEQIMPSIIKETSIRDSETMKSVDYQAIIGLLVETVKELNERIEVLENGATD